jgi:hypothetical protein
MTASVMAVPVDDVIHESKITPRQPAHLLMLRNLTLRGFSANSLLEEPAVRARGLAYMPMG